VRRLLRIAVWLVVLGIGGAATYVWLGMRRSLPIVNGTVTVAGLGAPETIIRDHAGVPHVFAASAADAVYGLGFAEAQDQRLQMELARRLGQGRLAALLGDARAPTPIFIAGLLGWSALDLDRQVRTLGLPRLAALEADGLAPAERTLYEAYAAGVNAATALAGATGTVRLLGDAPDPWTAADSILVSKLGDLSFTFQRWEEILTAELAHDVGEASVASFLPPYPDDGPPPLVDGDAHAAIAPPSLAPLLALPHVGPMGPVQSGVGSNNWVLAGRRTTTGAPILANDPHVDVNTRLYTAHLVAPGFTMVGQVVYGPYFTQGHNERIAWGVTLVGADNEDLFVEEIAPGDPPRVRTADGWAPLTLRREEIPVRGRSEPDVHIVRVGPHGPLVEDLAADQVARLLGGSATPGATYALALARTTNVPLAGATYATLAQATDWTSFRAALAHYPGVPLNFVYADVDGHIGYQMAGRIPLREGAAPTTPALGWERGHEWTGEVPFDALPHVLDPSDGVIATANARITGPRYPYHLATRWADMPFRATRIRELIAATEKLSPDDVAAMQLDVEEDAVADLVRVARELTSTNPTVRRFQDALADWDLRADPASLPAALVEAFRLELVYGVFQPKLSPFVFGDYLYAGEGILVALQRILGDERAAFFGTDPPAARAARAAVVEAAIVRAVERLRARMGDDWSAWSWGRIHTVTFENPLARGGAPGTALLGRLLNVGPFPAPGSPFTIDAGFWEAARPFSVSMAPTYRQIIDVGDFRRSRWAPAPPGQAEQRLSPHYGDLAEPWVQGRYRPMLWTRADVEADAESTLHLVPAAAR
jgi:penicillin amidase